MTIESDDRLKLAILADKYSPHELAGMLAEHYAEQAQAMVDCEVKHRFASISDFYYLVVAKVTGMK